MYEQIIWPFILFLFDIINNAYLMYRYRSSNLHILRHTHIRQSRFGNFCTIGPNNIFFQSTIGNYSYTGNHSVICRCLIGNYCSISSGVKISPGQHPLNYISTHPAFYSSSAHGSFSKKNYYSPNSLPTIIGHDVWIGTNSIIMDGITVGNGAIIAAGAVVTHNVPDFAIVGGFPAKIIRYRFKPSKIKFINSTFWWNKDVLFLKKHFLSFHQYKNFKKLFSK